MKVENAAKMYVDAAGYHRSTTAAVARGTKVMDKANKALEAAPDEDTRRRILEQRRDAAEDLRHSLQEHATAELRLDEAQQRRERFSQQLVLVLDGWEDRRLAAAAKIYDQGINHQP